MIEVEHRSVVVAAAAELCICVKLRRHERLVERDCDIELNQHIFCVKSSTTLEVKPTSIHAKRELIELRAQSHVAAKKKVRHFEGVAGDDPEKQGSALENCQISKLVRWGNRRQPKRGSHANCGRISFLLPNGKRIIDAETRNLQAV